jgi:hypothetical protein
VLCQRWERHAKDVHVWQRLSQAVGEGGRHLVLVLADSGACAARGRALLEHEARVETALVLVVPDAALWQSRSSLMQTPARQQPMQSLLSE